MQFDSHSKSTKLVLIKIKIIFTVLKFEHSKVYVNKTREIK